MSEVKRSREFFKKAVDETLGAVDAMISTIRVKRGKRFHIDDTKAFVEAVKNMKPVDGQSSEIIEMHKQSVVAHYETLRDLTDYIRPEDDPFVEHHQSPAILEILYGEDPSFRESVEKFAKGLDAFEDVISKYVVRAYGGFWGPTCVVDFAFIPGGTSNILNKVLARMDDIPLEHRQAILAAKSWGMNTSYGIGAAFREAIEDGKTASEAVKAEIE